MALIKSFRDVPPGGWRYVQPETTVRFESDTFDGLVAQVKPHRVYKGLPVETISEDIQRQLCIRLTKAECAPEPGEDYRPVKDLTAELTTGMVLSASKALLAFIAAGASFTEPSEAERRAAICRGCPLNKPASLCSCSSVYKLLEATLPKDRRVAGVSVCMACGCSLQLKCNLPIDVVQDSLPAGLVLPPWCWQQSPATP